MGFYGDQTGRTSCTPCPDGTSTLGKGSMSIGLCTGRVYHDFDVTFPKKNLKIPMRWSETVNRKKTDNAMNKRKMTKLNTMIYKHYTEN